MHRSETWLFRFFATKSLVFVGVTIKHYIGVSRKKEMTFRLLANPTVTGYGNGEKQRRQSDDWKV